MLAIDGFLRGLWVGAIVAAVWAVVAVLTGSDWMRPLAIWVFLAVGLIAAVVKIINASGEGVLTLRKALIVLKMRLARFWGKAEQTDVKLVIGASILILASVLYLGQYFSDAWFCLLDTVREAVTGRPVEWQCVKGVVRICERTTRRPR